MDISGNHQFSPAQPLDSNGMSSAQADPVAMAPALRAAAAQPQASGPALHHIGFVMEIAGSSSQVTLDSGVLNELMAQRDASVARAGQVGIQIKSLVGSKWLLARMRT